MIYNKMEGFFLINKTSGISSHDVVKFIKKKLNLEKAGHTGRAPKRPKFRAI